MFASFKKNGAQRAAENVTLFQAWVAEREQQNDICDYIRGGKINRSEIAKELGFSRSVFSQNPTIKKMAEKCDIRWCSREEKEQKVRPLGEVEASRQRAITKAKHVESSNLKLLEEITQLEAENRRLKVKLEELKAYRSARETFVELGESLKLLND